MPPAPPAAPPVAGVASRIEVGDVVRVRDGVGVLMSRDVATGHIVVNVDFSVEYRTISYVSEGNGIGGARLRPWLPTPAPEPRAPRSNSPGEVAIKDITAAWQDLGATSPNLSRRRC